MNRKILFLLLILPFTAFAADDFVQGKDYVLLPQAQQTVNTDKNKIPVIEFFNYGCPACYRFEPTLEKWLKEKPDFVAFQRVPVVFHSQWEIYAKAYYLNIAEALHLNDKLTPDLFAAVQNPQLTAKNSSLSTPAAMQTFFTAHGIKQQDFDAALNSPLIDIQIQNGASLMDKYQIYGIPTLVINGKYKTGLDNTNGNADKLIKIMQYLIQKSHQES